jgi:hypothetical protein
MYGSVGKNFGERSFSSLSKLSVSDSVDGKMIFHFGSASFSTNDCNAGEFPDCI